MPGWVPKNLQAYHNSRINHTGSALLRAWLSGRNLADNGHNIEQIAGLIKLSRGADALSRSSRRTPTIYMHSGTEMAHHIVCAFNQFPLFPFAVSLQTRINVSQMRFVDVLSG